MATKTFNFIKTFEDVDKLLLEVSKHESLIAKKEALMNDKIQKIREKFDEETAEAKTQIDLLKNDLEAFCIIRKEDFSKQRSVNLIHGSVGFRTNPPKVAMLNRKYTMKTALELLKKVFDGRYVRTKEEINKDEILTDYSAKVIDDEKLSAVGLRVDQDETFFYQINWESLNPNK